MILYGTVSNKHPEMVTLERLSDGSAVLRLTDNIREEERRGRKAYIYDEVIISLDKDRKETAQDIEENFDAWWAFGSEPEEGIPTLEERVSVLEDAMMELLGGEG